MTWEFARHMNPDRVLVMDIGQYGRSDPHLSRYDGFDTRVVYGLGPTPDDRKWLLDGSDVIYSAETWYEDQFPHEAKEAGVRTVLHVMPELFLDNRVADDIWVPTTYRKSHVPNSRLVPVPVALDRFTHKVRSPAEHFVALWAPAMLDRNGINVVFQAVEQVRVSCRVTILGAQQVCELPSSCPVKLDCHPREYPVDYFDLWPDDADVLLMPRRYAGLSLPVQEAAARGMAAVMTAVEPQNEWPNVVGIATTGHHPHRQRMAGGMVDVWDPDPTGLARAIENLATDPVYATEMSGRARGWAEALSWETWAPRYRTLLGLD